MGGDGFHVATLATVKLSEEPKASQSGLAQRISLSKLALCRCHGSHDRDHSGSHVFFNDRHQERHARNPDPRVGVFEMSEESRAEEPATLGLRRYGNGAAAEPTRGRAFGT
jgi:hypothetical protein